MQCRLTFVIAVTVSLIFKSTHSRFAVHSGLDNRNKNADVFNLLLGLYKLNPLKGSQVYKSFSQYLLSGNETPRFVSDTNEEKSNEVNQPNESGNNVKLDLSEIEKIIHVQKKRPPLRVVGKPDYDIENVNIENFKVDVVINEKLAKERNKQKKMLPDNHVDNNFSGLYEHISSKEFENDVFVTKLLPVNDTVGYKPKESHLKFNPEENYFNTYYNQNQRVDNTASVLANNNEIQDAPVMTNNLDSQDVVMVM